MMLPVKKRQNHGNRLDVNDALISLRQFGNWRLGFYGSWCASIKMNTTVTGGEFEISSGFRHETPADAMQILIDRVNEALGIALHPEARKRRNTQ